MPPTNPPAMPYITLGGEPKYAAPVHVKGPAFEWIDDIGKQVWPADESSPRTWTVYFWRGEAAGSWWAVGPYARRQDATNARRRYLKLPTEPLRPWAVSR